MSRLKSLGAILNILEMLRELYSSRRAELDHSVDELMANFSVHPNSLKAKARDRSSTLDSQERLY